MAEYFSGVSSVLSGSGTWAVAGITGVIPAPPDGLIVYRGSIECRVTSFDQNLIWNAQTATLPQLRGGRFLVMDRSEVKQEYFVNRTGVLVPRLSALALPADDDDDLIVGGGQQQVSVIMNQDGYTYFTDIKYEFSLGVQARFFYNGEQFFYYNQANTARFLIGGVNVS